MQSGTIRSELFRGEPSRAQRELLVVYVRRMSEDARDLTWAERAGDKGGILAIGITGALVHHQKWIEGGGEPILGEMLEVACDLDRDAGQADRWQRLFKLVQRLT